MSRGATEEQIGTSDERLADEPASSVSARPWAVRYGVAVAAGVVALLIQSLLVPVFGVSPYATPS